MTNTLATIPLSPLFLHPEIQELIGKLGLAAIDALELAWHDAGGQAIFYYGLEDLWMYYSPETAWQRVYAGMDDHHCQEVLEKKYGYRYLCTAETRFGDTFSFYIDRQD